MKLVRVVLWEPEATTSLRAFSASSISTFKFLGRRPQAVTFRVFGALKQSFAEGPYSLTKARDVIMLSRTSPFR